MVLVISQFSALSTASSSQDLCVWSDAHENTVKLEWWHLPRLHLAPLLHPLVYYAHTHSHTYNWPLWLCMPYHGSVRLSCGCADSYTGLWRREALSWFYMHTDSHCQVREIIASVFLGTAVVFYLWKIKLNKLYRKTYYNMIVLANGLIPLFSPSGIIDSSKLNRPCWMMAHNWPLASSLHHVAHASECSLFLLVNLAINKTLERWWCWNEWSYCSFTGVFWTCWYPWWALPNMPSMIS